MVTNRIQLSKKIEWDRQRKISFFGYFKTIDDLKTKSEEKIEVLKNLRIQTFSKIKIVNNIHNFHPRSYIFDRGLCVYLLADEIQWSAPGLWWKKVEKDDQA